MNILGKGCSFLATGIFLFVFTASVVIASTKGAEGAETKCRMTFNLSGWSIIYETASGRGNVSCDNGQSAAVRLRIKGGGLTAGKYRLHGRGEFSDVWDISEIYGAYAAAEAHAGAVRSANAQVLTKGRVSLAIASKGSGFDLGVAFSGFKIEPLKNSHK
ncbi:MAG TPA: hypothetical protein VK452_07040 [Dissulfurispiraceae bacterium]|nr:hypothetical protein [Dissulfurispiraceae bacterium]